jgi:glycosyltransferase involved in cell wall biosynthesis
VIRVLGLLPYPLDRAPGQRYRIEQWAPLLRESGVQIEFSTFLPAWVMGRLYRPGHLPAKAFATLAGCARRMVEAITARGYDAIFLYREAALVGPPWLETLLARRAPLVFDFDDAIYLPSSSGANPLARWLKVTGKTAAICRLASCTTVGNDHLADFARRHSAQVTVIPTTIDTGVYTLAERPPNPRPVVGWSGSLTTADYLRELAPALRRLAATVDFELRVIGAEVAMDGVRVQCLPWRAATEADDLRPFDVGLMPLTDDAWSRGKCGLKALQYMALGVPPIVSPVGVNARIVRDGENGVHARSEDEWVSQMARLIGDPLLRQRLGREARRTVEEGYSARVQAPRMAAVLRAAGDAWRRHAPR